MLSPTSFLSSQSSVYPPQPPIARQKMSLHPFPSPHHPPPPAFMELEYLRLRCQESPQGQPQMWECLQLPLRLWPLQREENQVVKGLVGEAGAGSGGCWMGDRMRASPQVWSMKDRKP